MEIHEIIFVRLLLAFIDDYKSLFYSTDFKKKVSRSLKKKMITYVFIHKYVEDLFLYL